MKKVVLLLASFALTGLTHAALKPGDSLTPYEIKNVETGKECCQVCAYGSKAKVIAFGKLDDEAFWADLKRLEAINKQQDGEKLGIFAQVIDSKDPKAVRAAAEKCGVTFPVVIAAEEDWDTNYKVGGVSRTIYYAPSRNKVAWTSIGLDEKAAEELEEALKKDLAG